MNGEQEVAQEITETNIETNNNKNMAEFVKAEDFHKYFLSVLIFVISLDAPLMCHIL